VDLNDDPHIGHFKRVAVHAGIDFSFVKGDSVRVSLIGGTDMLFIDTLHVYAQLKRELAAHHFFVRRYIVLHDTTVDEWAGEVVRTGSNATLLAQQTGYPEDELTRGLWPAVAEFLAEHSSDWELAARYTNNNGLTVLERVREVVFESGQPTWG
jgi:hypothetical protein